MVILGLPVIWEVVWKGWLGEELEEMGGSFNVQRLLCKMAGNLLPEE